MEIHHSLKAGFDIALDMIKIGKLRPVRIWSLLAIDQIDKRSKNIYDSKSVTKIGEET